MKENLVFGITNPYLITRKLLKHGWLRQFNLNRPSSLWDNIDAVTE